MRKPLSPLVAIFITVFLDMLSFGVFIPDIQVRGSNLGAKGLTLGALIAIFSLAQFVTAPIMGRLSDKIGRRQILIISTVLSILSYCAYGFATTLPFMFLSRILGGIGSANVGVAYAYVADVTKPMDRAKGMGMIGAAFGLGFVLGPPLGVLMLELGNNDPMWLGGAGVALGLVNLLYLVKFLPEPETHGSAGENSFSLQAFKQALKVPELSILLLMFFAYGFGFSNLESTYMLLATKQFHWTQMTAGLVLTLVGVVMAFMQGYFIRILMPKFGERKLVRAGYLIVAPVIALVPFALPLAVHLVGVVLLGVGNGMAQPSLGSMISQNTPKTMQGSMFGVTHALGAFARIVGPLVGNTLFNQAYYYPYLFAGLVMLIPVLLSWTSRVKELPRGDSEPIEVAG